MKTAQVVGRLGRGIETKVLPSGSSVAEFDLAVGAYDFSKKEKDTYWISCVVFGQTADFLAQYAEPGDTIAIAGELRLEKYHSKKYTDDEGNGAPMTRFTIVADMAKRSSSARPTRTGCVPPRPAAKPAASSGP